MNCTKCGASMPDGASFCPACGNPMNANDLAQRAGLRTTAERVDMRLKELRKSQKEWGTGAMVALGIALVAVLGGIWAIGAPMFVIGLVSAVVWLDRKEEADKLEKLR